MLTLKCKCKCQNVKKAFVIFHNVESYYSHIIKNEINKFDANDVIANLDVIPNALEK